MPPLPGSAPARGRCHATARALSCGCRRGRARRRRCCPAPGGACSAPAARSGCAASARAVALRQRQAQLVALRCIEAPHQARQRLTTCCGCPTACRRWRRWSSGSSRRAARKADQSRRIPLVLQAGRGAACARRPSRCRWRLPAAAPSSQVASSLARRCAPSSPSRRLARPAGRCPGQCNQLARERPGRSRMLEVVRHVEHRRRRRPRTGATSGPHRRLKRPAPPRSVRCASSGRCGASAAGSGADVERGTSSRRLHASHGRGRRAGYRRQRAFALAARTACASGRAAA